MLNFVAIVQDIQDYASLIFLGHILVPNTIFQFRGRYVLAVP